MSRSTTKLHSAISPSMKDQWSGKTLRICFFMAVPSPSRSSAQVAIAPAGPGFLAVAAVPALLEATLLVSMLNWSHAPRSSVPRVR